MHENLIRIQEARETVVERLSRVCIMHVYDQNF